MKTNNTLAHHGIKGQKWGIRRYQNEDGSLTEAGKKRYYNADGSLTRSGRKNAMRNYDYRKSDQYQSAKGHGRAALTNKHNYTKALFGEKAARRMDFKEYEEGKNRRVETAKEYAKYVALGTAAVLAVGYGAAYVQDMIENKDAYISANEIAQALKAQRTGAPTVNKEIKGKVGSAIQMAKSAIQGRKYYYAFRDQQWKDMGLGGAPYRDPFYDSGQNIRKGVKSAVKAATKVKDKAKEYSERLKYNTKDYRKTAPKSNYDFVDPGDQWHGDVTDLVPFIKRG